MIVSRGLVGQVGQWSYHHLRASKSHLFFEIRIKNGVIWKLILALLNLRKH